MDIIIHNWIKSSSGSWRRLHFLRKACSVHNMLMSANNSQSQDSNYLLLCHCDIWLNCCGWVRRIVLLNYKMEFLEGLNFSLILVWHLMTLASGETTTDDLKTTLQKPHIKLWRPLWSFRDRFWKANRHETMEAATIGC